MEPYEEPCEHCQSHVPAKGYWVCPICDAEWPEEDEGDVVPDMIADGTASM